MSGAPQPRRYSRVNTLAKRTDLHPETIRKAIRSGSLKAVRLGKRALGVEETEFERWIDGLQKQEIAPKPGKPWPGSSPLARETAA